MRTKTAAAALALAMVLTGGACGRDGGTGEGNGSAERPSSESAEGCLLPVADVAAASGYPITTARVDTSEVDALGDAFNAGCQYVTAEELDGASVVELFVGPPIEPAYETTDVPGLGDKAVMFTSTGYANGGKGTTLNGTAIMHIGVGDQELRVNVLSPDAAEAKEARIEVAKRVAAAALAAYQKTTK